MERLDKFLVAAGVGSRSQVKDILKAGRITVDGMVERDNSRKIDPEKQTVCCDGESLSGRRFVVGNPRGRQSDRNGQRGNRRNDGGISRGTA